MIPVAIDGRRLQDRPMTGVGRSLMEALPYLAERFDVTLLTNDRRPPVDGNFAEQGLFGWAGLPEPLWLHVGVGRYMRRRSRRTVLHGVYGGLPFGWHGPSVVTIHDLSHEEHREDYSAARAWSYRITARRAARHASVVLAPSEYVRQGLIGSYGTDPARTKVAPNGAASRFHPRPGLTRPAVLAQHGVADRYVVAIGGARRRALGTAVEAWSRLPDDGRPDLVVVGSEAPPALAGITHLGRIDDDPWAEILAGAEVLIYPTRYEGYGMPAMEAAASGVAVVCAPVGPLPEVLGEAAEWSRSLSTDDLAAALLRVVSDPGRRAELAKAGLARAAAAPSWADIATMIGDAYTAAYEDGPR
jgi:glycosyltransferase involved in cell wall biosynthesis